MTAEKPSKDVIYLDVDDEITAVIDKMEAAKHKVVALVLPKRFTTLQSIVNMRLLKRSADDAGKSVVLITSDQALLPLAGAAGLHVAKNLQSKPEIPPSPVEDVEPPVPVTGEEELDTPAKLDYHRSIGELAAAHTTGEPETIPLDDDEEETAAEAKDSPKKSARKDKKLKVPNFERFRLLMILGALGLIGLIVFIIFAIWVLPKATITLHTTSSPLTSNLTLNASDKTKALDLKTNAVPAELKNSEQTVTEQVKATGQKNLGEKAGGKVTLSLTDCSQDQVTVPAGTGISSSGLTFITQQSANLQRVIVGNQCKNSDFPSVSSKSVDVVAQSPGSKYNISPSSFTVVGFSNVSGSSSNAMSGGTDNTITVVSQQDVDKIKAKLTAEESDKFSKTLNTNLDKDGYFVVLPTLKLSDPAISASPAVDQQASTSNVTAKITYSVMVIKKDDLRKAITEDLEKQIDKKRQKVSSRDVLKDLEVTLVSQTAPGSATLKFQKDTTAVPVIDQSAVKSLVGGKEKGNIRSTLELWPGVEKVEVSFSPFWVSKAPKKPQKVLVVQKEIKDQSSGQ